jgi:hypothetical protein
MKKWNTKTLKFHKDATWTAAPGNKILVLDRGKARFEFPEDWVVIPKDSSVAVHDKQPPADSCNFEISTFPFIDPDAPVPIQQMVDDVTKPDADTNPRKIVPARIEFRGANEFAWSQYVYDHPDEPTRPIQVRTVIARSMGVYALITWNAYEDRVNGFEPVWKHLLDSLVLNDYIADPTRGPRVQ